MTEERTDIVLEETNKKKKTKKHRSLSKKFRIAIAIIIAVVVAIAVFGFSAFQKTTYISDSDLEKVVCISKVSTARFVHNGIADIKNKDGDVSYYVYYKSTVTASVDMSKIKFSVDDKKKTITPVIPDIEIERPVIDESSFEFMPENADYNFKDVLTACKNDAQREVKETDTIYNIAEQNLKQTIEGLLLPVIEPEGYEIVWNEESAGDNNETE